MRLTCEYGHHPRGVIDGDRCGEPVGTRRGNVCQNRVFPEPLVVRCERCDRGIYAEGWCSFCGRVDPRCEPEVQAYPDPQNVTAKAQVTGGQNAAQRKRNSRSRAAARRVQRAKAILA